MLISWANDWATGINVDHAVERNRIVCGGRGTRVELPVIFSCRFSCHGARYGPRSPPSLWFNLMILTVTVLF